MHSESRAPQPLPRRHGPPPRRLRSVAGARSPALKIVRASVTPIRRRLRQPILTGAGSIEVRDGLLLEIHDADGHCGLGEAAPLPHMGTESLEACRNALRSSAERIVAGTVTDSEPRDGALQLAPASRAAV
ncbi:MAG: hypothetical protein ACYTGV_14450 [Planctomycetota bacterium]